MRSDYTNLVQSEKYKYLRRLGSEVSNPQTSQKRYWTALKKLLNKTRSTVIPPILHNNIFVTDNIEKCTLFNNYLKKQCTVLNTTIVLPPFAKTTNLTLNQIHIDPNRVLELIRKLNINKSHGHDGISARMLKLYDDTLVIPLTIVFKNCIIQGYFPKRWKKANVTPVHKKKRQKLNTKLSTNFATPTLW